MAHTLSTEAIVLKAYDIGEADRLCILFTKDFGRIAARAHAVRKLTSRKGGSILPLQESTVDLTESSAGYTVTRATCINAHDICRRDLTCFVCAQQAVSLLLKNVEDQVPLPVMYELLQGFLVGMRHIPPLYLLGLFSLAFFHELGSLPSLRHSIASHIPFAEGQPIVISRRFNGLCLQKEDPLGRLLSPELITLLFTCTHNPFTSLSMPSPELLQEFTSTVASLLEPGVLAPLPVSVGNSSGVTPI